jgi:hypothetical protein
MDPQFRISPLAFLLPTNTKNEWATPAMVPAGRMEPIDMGPKRAYGGVPGVKIPV